MPNIEQNNQAETYEILSQDNVDLLHENFMTRLTKRANEAAPHDTEDRDQIVEKAVELLLLSERARIDRVTTHALTAAIKGGEAALQTSIDKLKEKIAQDPWSDFRKKLDKEYSAREEAMLVAKTFGDQDRIYLKLKEKHEVSHTQELISEYLKKSDYEIVDYIKGYATDKAGKQQFKIGKLLKDHEYLLCHFTEDESRMGQKKYVVLSRNQKDLELMSTNRAWGSCMAANGIFSRRVPGMVGSPMVVAYLISENDPEINNPLSRILLKPYDCRKHQKTLSHIKRHGLLNADLSEVFNYVRISCFTSKEKLAPTDESVVFRSDMAYGLGSKAFDTAVDDFAQTHFNQPKEDKIYDLLDEIYADGSPARLEVKGGALKTCYDWPRA